MASEARIQEQARLLATLFPTGPIWPRDPDSELMKHVEGLAVEFADIEIRAEEIQREAHPDTAIESLDDWERALGLPDDCAKDATTLQERWNAVRVKWIAEGGQSKPYFEALATAYGYEVTITEFRPFRCGMSSVMDPLYDEGDAIRHQWSCEVSGDRLTYFRCGQSYVTDPFFKVTRAEDLECIFQRLKPAHTTLTFLYKEAT